DRAIFSASPFGTGVSRFPDGSNFVSPSSGVPTVVLPRASFEYVIPFVQLGCVAGFPSQCTLFGSRGGPFFKASAMSLSKVVGGGGGAAALSFCCSGAPPWP